MGYPNIKKNLTRLRTIKANNEEELLNNVLSHIINIPDDQIEDEDSQPK